MKFLIEQIAIAPHNPVAAKKLLSEMGAVEWVEDEVVAKGNVYESCDQENKANLSFNYDLAAAYEFEILDYTDGDNWVSESAIGNTVCHLGMHCSSEDLLKWRFFFLNRGIGVAQEVLTQSHSNEAIKDSRRYNYVIFNTREILGVDVKFIVRKNVDHSDYADEVES